MSADLIAVRDVHGRVVGYATKSESVKMSLDGRVTTDRFASFDKALFAEMVEWIETHRYRKCRVAF